MTWTRSRTVSSRFTPPYSERDWKFGQWTHAEFWFRRPHGRNPYGLYAAPPSRRPGLTMLERLKELVRHSAIYGLGSIVARVIAVLLLPLYTRYLSPSDYGLIETLVALSAVLTALVAQAMKSAFFRFYFDSAEPERRLLVVRNAFWGVLPDSAGVLMEEMALDDPSSWAVVGVDGQD